VSEIEITYFSDVLCVWAYVAQARIETVKEKFGTSVRIEHRFCSVFRDTAAKIASTWKDRGGYEGFGTHLQHMAERYPHVVVHPEIWLRTRPLSSASPHLFIKAVQQWEYQSAAIGLSATSVFDRVVWAFRCAFFRDLSEHCAVGRAM
jgi:predicted DsbA family dithiol-disulfide isomerase